MRDTMGKTMHRAKRTSRMRSIIFLQSLLQTGKLSKSYPPKTHSPTSPSPTFRLSLATCSNRYQKCRITSCSWKSRHNSSTTFLFNRTFRPSHHRVADMVVVVDVDKETSYKGMARLCHTFTLTCHIGHNKSWCQPT